MMSRRQILFTIGAFGGCRPSGRAVPNTPLAADGRCAIRAIVRTQNGALDLEVGCAVELPVQNELPSLRIGNLESRLSRYPDSGDTHHLIFTFESADFDAMPDGAEVLLYYGSPDDARRFPCGRLDKRLLK
jgi:hypothetical protein